MTNDALSLVRTYLANDPQIKSLLNGKESIYLIGKEDNKDVDPYIIYLYKPLGGRYIQDCQIEFRIIGKDLSKLTAIKSRLIKLLNYNRKTEIIRDKKVVIKDSKLLTGGGQVKNPNTGNYELVIYFLIKF